MSPLLNLIMTVSYDCILAKKPLILMKTLMLGLFMSPLVTQGFTIQTKLNNFTLKLLVCVFQTNLFY